MFKKFLASESLLIGIIVTGYLGWLCSRTFMENGAAFIGPEFLVRGFISLFRGGLALGGTLLFVKYLFGSVWNYTKMSGQKESDFQKSWRENPSDPRLWISCLVYVGIFYSLSSLLAL